METIRRQRGVLVSVGVLLAFGFLFLWGQSSATRSQAAAPEAAVLAAARIQAATMAAVPPAKTYRAGKCPTYTESVWDFCSYQTYTLGVYLSKVETSKLTDAQIQSLTRDFDTWIREAFPNANRDYRALCLVKYPKAVEAIQKPKGSEEEVLKAAHFSKPLMAVGKEFSDPKNYKVTITGFHQYYVKEHAKKPPVPEAQFRQILDGYGKWIAATDDCVTINTAGARSKKGNQALEAESCAVVCGGIVITSGNMSCGICVVTISGAGQASCAAQTCGAAVTCGNNAATCGGTCGASNTCVGATCGSSTCGGGTCSGQTCGVGATCGAPAATCGGGGATCGSSVATCGGGGATCGTADTCGVGCN